MAARLAPCGHRRPRAHSKKGIQHMFLVSMGPFAVLRIVFCVCESGLNCKAIHIAALSISYNMLTHDYPF